MFHQGDGKVAVFHQMLCSKVVKHRFSKSTAFAEQKRAQQHMLPSSGQSRDDLSRMDARPSRHRPSPRRQDFRFRQPKICDRTCPIDHGEIWTCRTSRITCSVDKGFWCRVRRVEATKERKPSSLQRISLRLYAPVMNAVGCHRKVGQCCESLDLSQIDKGRKVPKYQSLVKPSPGGEHRPLHSITDL